MRLRDKFESKKLVAAVAVGVLAFGAVGVMPTMATTNATLHKIVHSLGIDKDLTPYENMVGKSVTKEGITMSINEVIVDNDQVILSVTTTSEESLVNRYAGPGAFIHINGEEINNGMYVANSELVDDHTGHAVLVIPVEKQLEGELDIHVKLTTPLMDVERSPHWNYEFTANGDALSEKTVVTEIGQTVTLEDGTTIKLDKYAANPFADRIYFEVENDTYTSFYSVEGTDQDGNEVKFSYRMMSDGQGGMIAEEGYNNVVQNATDLTLSLCVDGEPVGQIFVINK